MESIKSNAGTIAVGLAATAIAGLLLYKTLKSSKDEEATPGQEEVVPERFFFIDPSLSIDAKQEEITKWVKEQVDALLSQTEDNTLRAPNGILTKEDFLILVNIIENRVKVFFDEEKTVCAKKRLPIYQEKGFDSIEYLDKLIADVSGFIEIEEMPVNEVLGIANVRYKCLEASYEDHVGDENTIDQQFVKNHMEILYFYPIKNEKSFEKEEALQLYTEVIGQVMDRFERDDTPGKFSSVTTFIKCFDMASIDCAKVTKDLSEADFRALVHDFDLLEEKPVQDLFGRVAAEINKHLEQGAETQLALERQLTKDAQEENKKASAAKQAAEQESAPSTGETQATAKQPVATEAPPSKATPAKDQEKPAEPKEQVKPAEPKGQVKPVEPAKDQKQEKPAKAATVAATQPAPKQQQQPAKK